MTTTATQLLLAVGEVGAGEKWTFFLLAPIAVIGGFGTVLARNAVHSAMWLALTMLTLGVFYIVQAGPFIGMVQIIVYTGAIMMLFLFVLMLVGRSAADSVIETLRGQRVIAILLGAGLAGLLATGVYRALQDTPVVGLDTANAGGNVQGLAQLLFNDYLYAFEATAALLMTAAVGAMLLAHADRRKEDKVGQIAKMQERFRPGNYPGPKAGPGVFATSTSVATPAKLPDGRPAERSISPILPTRELTPGEIANKHTEGK